MKEKHTQMWSPYILRRRQYIWPWYILSHHHVWHCTYQQIYQKLLKKNYVKKYWYPGVPSGGRWDIYDPDIFYSPTHVWHCFCLYCQRNKNTMITRQHTTVQNSDLRVNTDRGDCFLASAFWHASHHATRNRELGEKLQMFILSRSHVLQIHIVNSLQWWYQ